MAPAHARKLGLRFDLNGEPASLSLDPVRFVSGYASLSGERDDYFLGWLRFRSQDVPVFDLTQVLAEQPTAETLGSRIIVIDAGDEEHPRLLGLLAAGVTDTVEGDEAAAIDVPWQTFVPILLPMIPEAPAAA